MSAEIEALLAQARALSDTGPVDRAAQAYREAASRARGAGRSMLQAQALRHVSDLAREAGNADEALTSGNEALTLYRADPAAAPLDLANAQRVTALALEFGDRPEEAVPLWREARGLYAGLGIEAGVAECDQHLPRRSG